LEILKGPQGTLYGRNATGGAINILSKRPEFENGGYVRAGAGDFGLIEAEGAFNAALSENAAIRISGRASTQESFYDNSITGANLGDREAWGLRGQFAFEGQGWDANLKIQTSSDEGPATPYNHIGLMTPQSAVDAAGAAAFLAFPEFAPLLATDPAVGLGGVGAFCAPVLAGQLNPAQCADLTGFQDPTSEIRDTTSNFAGGNAANINTDDVTLHLNWDLGGGELTSITGWRSLDLSHALCLSTITTPTLSSGAKSSDMPGKAKKQTSLSAVSTHMTM
jgi:outer membrane receptor protein involved in Fe transport